MNNERQAVVEQAAREFYRQWVNTERGGTVLLVLGGDGLTPRITFAADFALLREGEQEKELERLRLERLNIENGANEITRQWQLALMEKNALAAERDRLRGALETYGTHKKDCHVFWKPDEDQGYSFPCSCGFEDALNPVPGGGE